jgi:hypothetical protein
LLISAPAAIRGKFVTKLSVEAVSQLNPDHHTITACEIAQHTQQEINTHRFLVEDKRELANAVTDLNKGID